MGDAGLSSSSPLGAVPEKKKRKKPDLPIVPIKNTADYQRMKLERLMANPEKPVMIPEKPKDKDSAPPPEFVRNVMGSSAGAGSGEFHVYRHIRRKEYARQKMIQEKSKKEELDDEFQRKLEENKKLAEERTAKKRAKRLRKKQKGKSKKAKSGTEKGNSADDSSSDDDSNNSENEDETRTNGDTSMNNNNSNGSNESAGQKNGVQQRGKSNQNSNNSKPKLVVPTYASYMSQIQPPAVVDSSSDSD